jgi:hypothetical protein
VRTPLPVVLGGVVLVVTLNACTGSAPENGQVTSTTPGSAVSASTSPRRIPSPTPSGPPQHGALAVTVAEGGPVASLVGLERARVIVEYPVAADRTGLFLLLESDADVVGPLRSATPSDAALALALDADLATAVTTGAVVDHLRRAGLSVVEELTLPGTMVRDPARHAPFNLYAMPSRIRAALRDRPAGADWPLGVGEQPSGDGQSLDEFAVPVVDEVTATWTWDPVAAQWLRTVGSRLELSATGERIAAGAVVVLEVQPAADRPPVLADLVGAGPAVALRDGVVSRARWERADAAAVPTIHGFDPAATKGTVWLHICATPCASASDSIGGHPMGVPVG